ncbi:MAG: hypothetical protein V1767_00775 [Chloroflexota bacterium]
MPDLYRKSDTTSSSEVLPPEIKIIQGTTRDSPEGAKIGQFCNAISSEFFDDFEFIYVDRDKTRTYWGRDTIEDEPPLCWSPDADSGFSADGKDCSKCKDRLDNAASVPANVRKTKCLIHYTIKGVKLPNWEPFMMRVTGVSVGEFMRLMSNFLYNPALRNKETGKPNYHAVIVPVKTEQIKSPAGISYGLKFGMFKPIKEQEVLTASFSISAELLGQSNVLQLEEGETLDEEAENIPQEIKQEPAPAPTIRTITPPAQSQATRDAESLYEGNRATTPKILIGYLETDGREIYAGDLVPAGTRVLKEKPAPIKETQTITPKDVGTITVKSPAPAPPARKATPFDISSL